MEKMGDKSESHEDVVKSVYEIRKKLAKEWNIGLARNYDKVDELLNQAKVFGTQNIDSLLISFLI